MMSQINAPIHSYKKDQIIPHPYYQNGNETGNEKENNFYLANETRYDDSDDNSERSKKDLF